ncbi:uncharacterized protein DS421_15g507730 [Arachis hypogaea]|nr:uncharacterized protein DS421_15g507730 [Arachis hypogaea]
MRSDLRYNGGSRRSPQWHVRQLPGGASSFQKGTQSWILLADLAKGSNRVCQNMPPMPEARELPCRTTRRTHLCHFTLAIRKMGARPPRTLPLGIRASQVLHCRNRLFHKMD